MMASAVHWGHLTDVERTCLSVSFARWYASAEGTTPATWPDGTPWYTDPLGPLFVAGIPPAKQQEMEEHCLKGQAWMRLFCAVRTAEIDFQIKTAVQESGARQMVLLGAGMDTRAWRLQWPPQFTVFEVDTQQVLDFKHSMLRQDSNADQQHVVQQPGQQQQHSVAAGLPPLSCDHRVAVVADASEAEELWTRLVAAGLSADTPTVWVLEGFIGYLERQAGNALMQLLAARSAPGSRIIMTAPPTPAEKERGHEAAIAEAAAAPAAAAAAAPAAAGTAPSVESAAGSGGIADGGSTAAAADAAGAVEEGFPRNSLGSGQELSGGERTFKVTLHHSTFEQPTATLARLSAAGWVECTLLTALGLGLKYGVSIAQPIVLGKTP